MLRRFLDAQLRFTRPKSRFARYRPLVEAVDDFLYEPLTITKSRPHIRDMIDLKRWMVLVVFALLPSSLFAIWNVGVHAWVYGSFDAALMREYIQASASLASYFSFIAQNGRPWAIFLTGCSIFFPILMISYLVGGFWEIVFAIVRRHDVSEGFLVTGILFALVLPSTIPYWMVAVGVSAGVIIGKENFWRDGNEYPQPSSCMPSLSFFRLSHKNDGGYLGR